MAHPPTSQLMSYRRNQYMSDSMTSIGIDLGTTNSVGSYYDGKEARVINSTTPDGIVPSVVVYRKSKKEGKEAELLVGQPAVDYAFRDPQNAVWSIKRLMGRAFNERKTEEVRERANYKIVKSPEGDDPGLRVELGDRLYT